MILPNFLVIGAAKTGTSSLYNYLNQHPQIYMSPAKEPKYTDNISIGDRQSLTLIGDPCVIGSQYFTLKGKGDLGN